LKQKKTQRDITAQLSSVKLDKIRNTVNPTKLGNPLISTGNIGTSVPMGNRPLPEVLSYINGKSKSSFADRNKKKMGTPLAVSSINSIDKKKKKKNQEDQ